MKKLFILLLTCLLCISVYAADSKLVSYDVLDDNGKSTGETYLAYEEDQVGTYASAKGEGTVKWNVRIYTKKGEIYFVLKENGKDKDVSTSGTGRSADIGCVYTVTFTSIKKGNTKSIYGGLKISSSFQTNELLCYENSSLSQIFKDKEFLASNIALDVSIKSSYGSYSLGEMDLYGTEVLLFDKAPYLEGIQLMKEKKYEEAIDVFEKYREENSESYTHYNTHLKVNECYQLSGTYSIGSTGPAGGWIFYDCDDDNDSGNADGLISTECGWRYLEAASADLNSEYMYGGYLTEIGNTSTAIGKGKANTAAIINKLGAGTYAAKACWDYEYNGYDDWFLPSKDELNLMYKNLHMKGIGDFELNSYWSSSEFNSLGAWGQDFYDGNYYGNRRKEDYSVRPVRAFMPSETSSEFPEEEHSHSWNEGEITVEATCNEKGEKTYICTVCGATKIEPIEPTGVHNYVNGICLYCGYGESYKYGDKGPAGGWIFYDCDADNDSGNADGLISSECGWRYLEAAPADLDSKYAFGNCGTKIGNTSTSIGKGKANTSKIIDKFGAGEYAAKACWEYECNDYDDWFLPSIDELNLMYMNLRKKGIGNFKNDGYYWSSSESNSYYAWYQNFSNGKQNGSSRSYNSDVRPVRAFL